MKRISLALAALLPLVAVSLAMGQTITQGTTTNGWIKGSGHDFSQSKYTWSGGEICKPCHTPHNAVHPEISGAIWAHDLSTNSYQTSFTADPTDGHNTSAASAALDSKSRLCMSCHDGTVALDAFAGGAGTSGVMGMAAGTGSLANLGTDLSNDHPVGVDALYSNVNAGTATSGTFTNTSNSWQLAVWSSSRKTYQLGGGKLSLVNLTSSTDGRNA
jgi:hypothetical protein